MDHQVRVTDRGEMQVEVDGAMFPPLPLAVVKAMSARIPEAEALDAKQALAAAVRALTDLLVSAPAASGSIVFTPSTVEAVVDSATFDLARAAFGEPDAAGEIHVGPVVIRRQPPPA